MDALALLLGAGFGAAVVSGIFSVINTRIRHRAEAEKELRDRAERELERIAGNHLESYAHLLVPTNRLIVALRDYWSVDELTVDQSSLLLDQVHEIALEAAREFAAATNPSLNLAVHDVDIGVLRLCEEVRELLSVWRTGTDSVEGRSVEIKLGEADEEPYWIDLATEELAEVTTPFRELVISSVMVHRPLDGQSLESFGKLVSTLETLREQLKRVTTY